MRKAIIVIEEPNKCSECPLYDHTFWSCNYTNSKQRDLDIDKLSDCPLKHMPERINPLNVDVSNLLDLGYMYGRNDLINQMESGENE